MSAREKALSIQERNERFDAMSPEERRAAIAEDVIAQVRLGIFTAYSTYLSVGYGVYQDYGEAVTLQELADDSRREKCEVCARGAAIVSAASLFDRVPSGGAYRLFGRIGEEGAKITDYEESFFSREQSALMEAAFEMDGAFYRRAFDVLDSEIQEAGVAAERFGSKYRDSKVRMVAIYANVIEGNGTFDPTRKVAVSKYMRGKLPILANQER